MADMMDKDRMPAGNICSSSVLSEADVNEIIRLGQSVIPHSEIAKKYPVGRRHISRIIQGKRRVRNTDPKTGG